MENISSKIEKKEQQEKKEDYLKKYFLLKYLYGGKEEDFVQFKKLTDGMEDDLHLFLQAHQEMFLFRFEESIWGTDKNHTGKLGQIIFHSICKFLKLNKIFLFSPIQIFQ